MMTRDDRLMIALSAMDCAALRVYRIATTQELQKPLVVMERFGVSRAQAKRDIKRAKHIMERMQ